MALYAQADTCDSVWYVESGRVRLSVIEPGGREAIVGLLGNGAFLGEEAVRGLPGRQETATALTSVQVAVVAKTPMVHLIHSDETVRDLFVAHLLARHLALETNLSDQLLHCGEQRVARALLMLAGCSQPSGCACVLPDVSQAIVAEMVGTTRSHVNMFMRKFRTLGLIERRGRALLVTPSLLDIVNGVGSRDPRSAGRQTRRPDGTGGGERSRSQRVPSSTAARVGSLPDSVVSIANTRDLSCAQACVTACA